MKKKKKEKKKLINIFWKSPFFPVDNKKNIYLSRGRIIEGRNKRKKEEDKMAGVKTDYKGKTLG